MTRIALEGLIGVGKSTVLGILQTNYRVAYEPLGAWSLLTQFYANKTKYALPFEIQILCSYCHTEFDSSPDSILLMERSPDSALHVFANSLHRDNHLTDAQYDFLKRCSVALPVKHADYVIFLDLEPEECLKRIHQRNREAETTVSLEVLRGLRDAYQTYLQNAPNAIMIPLQASDGPYEVAEKIEEALRSLQ
jgi:deoxyadenosine/deoxycytidine kinase